MRSGTEDEFKSWVVQQITSGKTAGEIIRELRTEWLGLTQERMVRGIGMDMALSSYTKWESGKVQPSAQNFLTIIRVTYHLLYKLDWKPNWNGGTERGE